MSIHNVYLQTIFNSMLVFLFTTTLITLPILTIQYRKNGFLSVKRSIALYAFIFYLQTIYLLAVLPLPASQDVVNDSRTITSFMQLIPFHFISDIAKENIAWNVYAIATAQPIYQLIFNILMFVPLGIFLRNLFKLSFKKVILIGFLVSLFLELTQLSGLYFIYPKPYRLFDVDDLMANTLGAILGFQLAPILSILFPKAAWEEAKRKQVLNQSSMFAQYLILIVDMLLFATFNFVLYASIVIVLLGLKIDMRDVVDTLQMISKILSFTLLFVVLPSINKGNQTLAMILMKYRMEANSKVKVIFRNIVLYTIYIGYLGVVLNVLMNVYYWILIVFKKNQNALDKQIKLRIYKYF